MITRNQLLSVKATICEILKSSTSVPLSGSKEKQAKSEFSERKTQTATMTITLKITQKDLTPSNLALSKAFEVAQ